MTNSEKTTPPTCFSSFLRRLLCSGSLPTHPDLPTSSYSTATTTTKLLQPPPPSTPPGGVVARLMGLDSLPTTTNATVPRSRSVNSFDFSPRFHLFQHPFVRTSVSFREVPTFLQNSKGHDFFVVCLDKDDGIGKTEMGLTLKEEKSKEFDQKNKKKDKVHAIGKTEVGLTLKEEKSMEIDEKNKNKGIRRECFDKVHEIGKTKVGLTLKGNKSTGFDHKNKNKEVRSECFHKVHEIGKTEVGLTLKKKKSKEIHQKKERERERLKGKISKKSQSLSECGGRKKVDDDDERVYTSRSQRYNHPLPRIVKHEMKGGEEGEIRQCRKSKKKSKLKSAERGYSDEYCVKVLMEVCRLTEEETKGCVLKLMDKKMMNNFQEISYELGHEILQVLLYEVVHELCVSS